MRIAFALVCALALAALVGPAKAGDYYYAGGYYGGGCCNRAVVVEAPPPRRVVHSLPGAYSIYGIPTGRYVTLYPSTERRRVVRQTEHDFYTTVADYAQMDCHWQQVPLRAGKSLWVWGVKTDCW
jgi:hypothetical protein